MGVFWSNREYTYLPTVDLKTGQIYKTTIFRHWKTGGAGTRIRQTNEPTLPLDSIWTNVPDCGAEKVILSRTQKS